jgi:predicted ATPase
MLFLMEDAHWADPASCLLLGHLAPTLGNAPVMFLATAREDEIANTHPISEPIAEFGRLQAYGRVGLSGLRVGEVEEMLGSLGAGPPPQGLARTVFEDTEGNAFFVTELISHLQSEGALLDESGAWRQDFLAGQWDVPDSVRAVIQRRG